MMTKRMAIIGMALALAASATADYVQDREAAVKLAQEGGHEAALAAFLALAEAASSDFQKADALKQAALSAARLNQHERAIELALQIPLEAESKAAQMTIMNGARQWQAVIDAFAEEELARWPDYLAGHAFRMRGQAYYFLKQAEAAEADLEQAARYPHVERFALDDVFKMRGDNFRLHLQDDDRAAEMYRRVGGPPSIEWGARVELVRILSRQGKHDEAIGTIRTVLEDPRVANLTAWHSRLLCTLGDALAAAGKKAEAAETYKRTLEVEGIPEEIKTACEAGLAALQDSNQ